jgi:hypothetical protein
LCPRHAAEYLGKPPGQPGTLIVAPEQWEPFVGELVARHQRDGSFPTVAELSEMGELGSRMAKWAERPQVRILDFLREQVQKCLASK